MKNVILKTKYVLLALSILFTFSCSPEDGEMGAEGPVGKDGNANVTSVVMLDPVVQPGINSYSVPELTQDIVDRGMVFGYFGQDGAWFPMSKTLGVKIHFIGVGNIKLDTDFTSNGNRNFRFVLIASN